MSDGVLFSINPSKPLPNGHTAGVVLSGCDFSNQSQLEQKLLDYLRALAVADIKAVRLLFIAPMDLDNHAFDTQITLEYHDGYESRYEANTSPIAIA